MFRLSTRVYCAYIRGQRKKNRSFTHTKGEEGYIYLRGAAGHKKKERRNQKIDRKKFSPFLFFFFFFFGLPFFFQGDLYRDACSCCFVCLNIAAAEYRWPAYCFIDITMKERKSHVFIQPRRVLSVSPAGLQIVQLVSKILCEGGRRIIYKTFF